MAMATPCCCGVPAARRAGARPSPPWSTARRRRRCAWSRWRCLPAPCWPRATPRRMRCARRSPAPGFCNRQNCSALARRCWSRPWPICAAARSSACPLAAFRPCSTAAWTCTSTWKSPAPRWPRGWRWRMRCWRRRHWPWSGWERRAGVEGLEGEASGVNAGCSAAALLISRSALQLHGAIGYTQECALSLFYKRTLRLSAWLGNASAHQRHYAALAAAAPTGAGPAPDDAAWEQGFPRTADWAAMPEAPFRRMLRAFLRQHYPAPLRYLSPRARLSEMRAWYLRLSAQGWIAPSCPQAHGGMGLPADKLIAWIEELEQYGVARAPDQGIVMIGPLLIQHGTPGQQQRFLPKILSGEHVWCQGYSEPNAGSDLAGLRTEAVRAQDAQGEHFIVNGQKIWTTLAQDANHIFMLVRTDKNAKKEAGISFLLCDLRTPGITIRPIQTLAGEPDFCALFFDHVRVPAENLVGQLHAGWSIAKALLGFERLFLGSPKQSQYALGQLERLAQARRLFADPVFVQRYTALRLDVADLSAAYAGFANIVKAGKPLPASVSLLQNWASETYHRIGALLVEASEEQGAIAGDQELDGQTFNALAPLIGASSAMIYGGTNEIQRNILARQVLHLPG